VVTGTSIRGVKPVGSESITLTKEDIQATGLNNVGQILNTLPQFQNFAPGGNQETSPTVSDNAAGATFGGNQSGNTGINLRGLGNDATLVLIDGRRASASGGESVVDANQIPLAALERIEIVADGASAVYGSDAVAGVVNYVLRKDYEGIEANLRYTTQTGSHTTGGSITIGRKWDLFDGGNALFTYDTEVRTALASNAIPFFRSDKRPVGGSNSIGLNGSTAPLSTSPYITRVACPPGQTVVPAGSPPLFRPAAYCQNAQGVEVPGTITAFYYAVPPQSGSNKPTLAEVLAGGAPVFATPSDYTDQLGRRERHSATMYLRQDVTDAIQLTLSVAYSQREDERRAGLINGGAAILNPNAANPAGSPWLITGIPGAAPPGAPTAAPTTAYTVRFPVGERIAKAENDSLNSTLGLKWDLPADWAADFGYTYTYSNDMGGVQDRVDGYVLNAGMLTRNLANGTFNPYSTSNPDSVWATMLGSQATPNTDRMEVLTLKFDGPLFELPGGKVRAAVGFEYNHQEATRAQISTAFSSATPPVLSYVATLGPNFLYQEIESVFAEVYIPVVSSQNAMTLVRSLSLNLSGRHDEYNSFGGTDNPKIGITYKPIDDLILRGSYSTAFRSPGLNLARSNPNDVNILCGGCAGFPVPVFNIVNNTTAPSPYAGLGANIPYIAYVGRGGNLKPETSENYQWGFDYDPNFIPGLRVSGTWYDIDYRNKIDSPDFAAVLANNAVAQGASDIIYILQKNIDSPSSCVPGDQSTYDPLLVSVVGADTLTFFDQRATPNFGFCTAKLLVDGRIGNTASQRQKGFDASINYTFRTDLGRFSTGASITKITSIEARRNGSDGVLLPAVLDFIGGPLDTRGRASLRWDRGNWNVSLFANYVGSYRNNRPGIADGVQLAHYTIPSHTTYDLTVAYNTGDDAPEWAQGIRASISLINATDEDPPYALSTQGQVYDSSAADPYGRIITINLGKAF
jgi:iron complex outermembrane recepter protein